MTSASSMLLVIILFPMGFVIGEQLQWQAGTATLLAVMFPVLLAACETRPRISWLTGAAGAAAVCLEPFLRARGLPSLGELGYPIASAGILCVGAQVFGYPIRLQKRRMEELREHNEALARDLFVSSRSLPTAGTPEPKTEAPSRQTPFEVLPGCDADQVNYPLLLLAIQDIGRKITTKLQLDSLFTTIIATAKANLQCQDCRLFLYDSETGGLTDPLQERARSGRLQKVRRDRGAVAWVVKHKQLLTQQAVISDTALGWLLDEDPDMPTAVAPMLAGGSLVGVLVVDYPESDEQPSLTRLLYVLAHFSALAIRNAQLFKRLDDTARRDGMTGMLNHTAFHDELKDLLTVDAESRPLSVLMGDIDHFKLFNDTYGHQAGDHVLREVARKWKLILPEDVVLARYGGEEFIAALPDCSCERAAELAELLRLELEAQQLEFEGQQLRVTSSFGVAEWTGSGQPEDELIRSADEALYVSKRNGRNQVSRAPCVPESNCSEVAGGVRAAGELASSLVDSDRDSDVPASGDNSHAH